MRNLSIINQINCTKHFSYQVIFDYRDKMRIVFDLDGVICELKKPSERLHGSQINNSNHYSLHALLDHAYLENKYLGILKDTKKFIINSILRNTNKFDVLITTGGASVGEEDHLIQTIQKLGKIFFWKAAIKPGRPLAVGKIKNTFMICLPGNPVSVHLL